MSVIRLKAIEKFFDGKQALNLRDRELIFDEGIYGIYGASGCGKTTLLRIIAGLEKPDSGKLELSGRVSMVFQEDRLFPWMTVLENACADAQEETANGILRSLGLGEAFNAYPDTLSGGMKRRVALARALAAKYDILLLDEPFNGLDEINTAACCEAVKQSGYKTIIIVTHNIGLLPIDFKELIEL